MSMSPAEILAASRASRGVTAPAPRVSIPARRGGAAPLGNITKSCNPPPALNTARYALQDAASYLLPQERVSFCCRAMAKNENVVNVIQHSSGKLSYGNLARCSSVWVCPVCSAKIVAKRREELGGLVDRAVMSGVHVSMVTLTVPHGRSDDLTSTLTAICKAKRLMQNRKPFKRLSADLGLIGEVRTLEVTHGVNGWHPHFHLLFFTRRKMTQAGLTSDRSLILSMWQDAAMSAGLSCPNEHGCSVLSAFKGVADYVQKFGMDYEMTYSSTKTGAGRTPFQLLASSATGDTLAGKLFTEYAAAFRGKRQLVFSKGLKKMFGLDDSLTDQEIVESLDEDSKVVYVITREVWVRIVKTGQRGAFLDYLVSKLSPDAAHSLATSQKIPVLS